MIGRNVIGKIYKNKKIMSLGDGFVLKTKYKSNFGGTYDLVLSFRVDINGILYICTNKDLLLDTSNLNKENVLIENGNIVINKNNKYQIKNIIKPDVYNTQKTIGVEVLSNSVDNGLYIPLIFEVNKTHNILDMYLVTSIYENKEYIEVKIDNVKDEKIIIKTAKQTII